MSRSHRDLLVLARNLHRAAVADDGERLHAELVRLREALRRHVDAERRAPDRHSGAAMDVVLAGQRRLVRLVDDVLFAVGAEDADCACVVRVAEIERALRRQAALELRGPRP